MSKARRRACSSAASLLAILSSGCGAQPGSGPIDVSVIGPPLVRAVPADAADRGPLPPPAAALVSATRQGLLRLDGAGQVTPGLAARWSASNDGRSLLFRLPDGIVPFPAEVIARRIRAAVAPHGLNPLRPLLGAVSEVKAVTPQVVDIELSAPRPDILPLFADPALGVGGARGGGPFALVAMKDHVATLRRLPDRDDDPDDGGAAPLIVRLRGERAATAVARFAAGRAALVTGGGFADFAIARVANPPPTALRFDLVEGLFGFAFAAGARGVAASAGGRRALAMTIDRERIARALAVPGWTPSPALLPRGLPEIATPAQPDWTDMGLDERRAAASEAIAGLRGAALTVRLAMPAGPGARLLFTLVRDDWRAIGVEAIAVPPGAPADAVLIDEVAPAHTAAFFLRRFACEREVTCTAEGDAALVAARGSLTLAERSLWFARADAIFAADTPFAALGPPIRWSLVAPSLDRFRDSPRGVHPLDELRSPPS